MTRRPDQTPPPRPDLRRAANQRCALALLLALGGIPACEQEAEARELAPIVRIKEGTLQGTRGGGLDRYLGIPYAAPPVGPLRWKAPQPATRWRGLRSADALPPRCAQLGGDGQEDCLYLNIFVPSRPRRCGPLPVIFFIHGGSLKVGSSFDNDPSRLAMTTDSVVVMINYRLGQFGFLAHPALGAEAGDGASGEYGLMDQQAALRWVHERISAFGGDPQNVTIAGGSAGGWSVCAHLVSQPVAGLFSRAVIQSGGCYAKPLAEAETVGTQFADAAGCPDRTSSACLRQKSTAEILASDSWAFESALVWGGRLLPTEPAKEVAAGRFQRVPMLIGGTPNELLSGLAGLYPMTEQAYLAFVNDTFGSDAPDVLEVYPSAAYSNPLYAFAEVLNDSGIAGPGSCASQRLAGTFAGYVPTYVYEFDDPDAPMPTWVTAAPGFEMGSSHGSDEVYWFDRPFDTVEPLDAGQRRLAQQMLRYLGAFAESGAPRAPQQRHWPRFDSAQRVLRFQPGAVSVRTDISEEHHCDFWAALGY